MWSSGPEAYHKKQAALMASYHADQFDIQQKHEKQLRQMNRAYDQQKGMLQHQQEGEVAEAEKRALYDAGNMHAYDLAGEQGLMSKEDVFRAQAQIAGIKLPRKPSPDKQYEQLSQVEDNIDRHLAKYSWEDQKPGAKNRFQEWFGGRDAPLGKTLMKVVQTDPTDPATKELIPAEGKDIQDWAALKSGKDSAQAMRVKLMVEQGILPQEAQNAFNYRKNGIVNTVVGKTKRMDESMKSPPKTRAPEPVKSVNSEDPLGWK